jgi:hypothetical protein
MDEVIGNAEVDLNDVVYAVVCFAELQEKDFACCEAKLRPRAAPRAKARNGSKETRLSDPTAAMNA